MCYILIIKVLLSRGVRLHSHLKCIDCFLANFQSLLLILCIEYCECKSCVWQGKTAWDSHLQFKYCNFRDAPLDFKGGAGSFCKKKKTWPTQRLKKKKKTWPTHRRGNKTWLTWEEKKLSCSGEKKNLPTHRRRGKKYTPGTSVIQRGGGRPLSKGGYLFDLWQWHSHPKCSLQVDALNFKHCMEHVESLYLNYQNLRIY